MDRIGNGASRAPRVATFGKERSSGAHASQRYNEACANELACNCHHAYVHGTHDRNGKALARGTAMSVDASHAQHAGRNRGARTSWS